MVLLLCSPQKAEIEAVPLNLISDLAGVRDDTVD